MTLWRVIAVEESWLSCDTKMQPLTHFSRQNREEITKLATVTDLVKLGLMDIAVLIDSN